jgi:hypothetical protein
VVCGSQRWGQLESRRVGKGCSTMSRGQQWAVVVGSGAPAEIRWHLGAGEHEQRLGKLARGSMGAMGGRWRLSTVASTSPEGRSRAAVVIGVWGWGNGRRTRGMGCRGSCSADAHEG